MMKMKQGKIAFVADLPVDGKFYVQEQYAPEGYVTDHEKKEFTFDYGSEDQAELVYEFVFENEPTTVAFSKLEITSEREIPGAHLEVRDSDGMLMSDVDLKSYTDTAYHKHEITNHYHVGNSGFSYMYLSDDRSEAIITKNREYLSYQRAMKELTYQKLQDTFQNDFKDVHQDTYWSYAVPWHDGCLVGCYEGYYLTRVAANDNRLLEPIEYTPGISIFGCQFRGMQAEQETMDMIAANGGIL